MKHLLLVCSLFLISFTLVKSQTVAGVDYNSDVFRVSPYGSCGASNIYRVNPAPCFSAPPAYRFTNVSAVNATLPSISAIVAINFNAQRFVYLGFTNSLMVLLQTNSSYSVVQRLTTTAGNWVGAVADVANAYVAFISSGGLIRKYPLNADGTLNVNTTSLTLPGTTTPRVRIFGNPLSYFSTGSVISEVNLGTMTVTNTTDVTTATITGNIQCGAVGTDGSILFSTDTGTIFSYTTSTRSLTDRTPVSVAGETFSLACAAKAATYAVFLANSGTLYQINFPASSTIAAPQFAIQNVGGPDKTFARALVNPDQSAVYFYSYILGGADPDTVYEFKLLANTVDFSSVIQPDVTTPGDPNFINPLAISVPLDTTVYIASNGSYPELHTMEMATYAPVVNGSHSLLYPDFSIPTNPTGPQGKVNSIADVTRTAGNTDLIFGCGVPNIPSLANSTLSLQARGPTVTYIRGTRVEAPAHGGQPNTDSGIALKLVSLDEVTLPGSVAVPNGTSSLLIRSMPFYSSDLAPWALYPISPGGSVVGFTWLQGKTQTDNPADAARQFNLLIPPYAKVVNNTIFSPASYGRAARAQPSQFSKGYIQLAVTERVFDVNATSTVINSREYNISSRTFQYQVSVTNWNYLSTNNFLRITIAVGLGPDGRNSTQSVVPLGLNTTLPPIFPGYMLSTSDTDWTLIVPQTLITGANLDVVDVPVPSVYDQRTQLLSLYLPYANNQTQTYTILLEYSYTAPPPPLASLQDGGGPKLLPLWIVIGVVGGLLIIACIIVIIVVIVVYKVAGDKIKAWYIDNQMDQTENALGRDRGDSPFDK